MGDFADVNGVRVVTGRVAIPRYGLWTADVRLAAAPVLPTQPGACSFILGDLTLTATVLRQGVWGSVTSARLVGGFGGWRNTLAARQYAFGAGVPVSMILGDAATELGEQITGVDPSAIVTPGWARPAIPGGTLLAQLATPYWWMAPSGVTTVGQRDASLIVSKFTVIDYQPESGLVVVSADSLADFAPGRMFSAPNLPSPGPIAYAEHVLDGGTARTEILLP